MASGIPLDRLAVSGADQIPLDRLAASGVDRTPPDPSAELAAGQIPPDRLEVSASDAVTAPGCSVNNVLRWGSVKHDTL